jgi:hypothetical protein
MLVFLDESFRTARTGHQLGVLYGIAIPEETLSEIGVDIYYMKRNSFGDEFARERELKGSMLLKAKNLRRPERPHAAASLSFVQDLLNYINKQRLVTLGVVCFDTSLRDFRCEDPDRLAATYRSLFFRLDHYMKRDFPNRQAKLVFDDIHHGENAARAAAITNFFSRSPVGQGYDSIVRLPFFAVSEAQNFGLQLADVVTTVCGMRFEGRQEIMPFWRTLKKSLYRFSIGPRKHTTLMVLKQE